MKLTKLFLISLFVMVFTLGFAVAAPSGATINEENSTAAAEGGAGGGGPHAALAGNVTEITLTGGARNTDAWQGYYGNVSGAINLGNSAGDIMYNWSLASPSGEVYASNESSVNWTGTACYDLSTGTTALESFYNIGASDADGIDETFNLKDHDAFSVNEIAIAENDCNSTRVYGDTGAGVDQEFEEVILEGGSNEVIWAALLESDMLGFDSVSHDFEMLVPEDGHSGDVATTNYYFWVEIE